MWLETTPGLKLRMNLVNFSIKGSLVFQKLYNVITDWLWAWFAESQMIKNTFAFMCLLYPFPEENRKLNLFPNSFGT